MQTHKLTKFLISIFVFFLVILNFSFLVSAQTDPVPVSPGNGINQPPAATTSPDEYKLLEPLPGITTIDSNTTFADYANKIIRFAIVAAGMLAVVMIVVGGVQYMSTDAIGGKEDGKETISNAFVGLFLALTSFVLLNTINPQLTFIKLGVDSISVEVKENSDFETISRTFSSGGGNFFGDTVGGNPNVTKNITTYDAQLSAAARTYGNPPDCTLLKAFMYAESGGNPNARSPVGAVGLIQLMPKTAAEQGVSSNQLTDPAKNTEAAAKYIKKLFSNACNGKTSLGACNVQDLQYVVAAYNGGPGANKTSTDCPGKTWWQCETNKGYKETRGYVKRVIGNYQKLKDNRWGCS